VRDDVPNLRIRRLVAELERSWHRARERGRFRLVHYSIQRNHLHVIVEAASARDLACGMKAIAARLARAVNRTFDRSGPVLVDRSHVHVLRSPREVRNAIAYVLLNARRHGEDRGSALRLARGIDPASSGRWFAGWGPPRPPCPDPPPVAVPRTWLLGSGWRRHGLIDPGEIPGGRRTARRSR
jgi:hypothetical protein